MTSLVVEDFVEDKTWGGSSLTAITTASVLVPPTSTPTTTFVEMLHILELFLNDVKFAVYKFIEVTIYCRL